MSSGIRGALGAESSSSDDISEKRLKALENVDKVVSRLIDIRKGKLKEMIFLENNGKLLKFRPKGKSICEATARHGRLSMFDVVELSKYSRVHSSISKAWQKPRRNIKSTHLSKKMKKHAKEDAALLQNAYELQLSRYPRKIPIFSEPRRKKTKWDYMLCEMRWMAVDFAKERRWKIAYARNVAYYVADTVQNRKLVEKDKEERCKRIRSRSISHLVDNFWGRAREYSKLRRGGSGAESLETLLQQNFKRSILFKTAKGFSKTRDSDSSTPSPGSRQPPSPFNKISGNKDSLFLFELQRGKTADSALDEKEVGRLLRYLKNIAETATSLRPRSNATIRKTGTRVPTSTLTGGKLRDYQHLALHWMVSLFSHGLNFILGDEAGLGSKVTTLSFLAYLAEERQDYGPHLILCSKNDVLNWEMRCKKWCPSMSTTILGDKGEQLHFQTRLRSRRTNRFRIIIAPHEIIEFQKENGLLAQEWSIIVLSNAEYLILSKRKEIVKERFLHATAKGKVALTDHTIAQLLSYRSSNLLRYWSDFLSFLVPELGSEKLLRLMSAKEKDLDIIGLLSSFMLSRNRSGIGSDLHPILPERLIICPMLSRQVAEYAAIVEQSTTRSTIRSGNTLGIAKVVRGLKSVCNHPDLSDEYILNTAMMLKENIVDSLASHLSFFSICRERSVALTIFFFYSECVRDHIKRTFVMCEASGMKFFVDGDNQLPTRRRTRRRRKAATPTRENLFLLKRRLNAYYSFPMSLLDMLSDICTSRNTSYVIGNSEDESSLWIKEAATRRLFPRMEMSIPAGFTPKIFAPELCPGRVENWNNNKKMSSLALSPTDINFFPQKDIVSMAQLDTIPFRLSTVDKVVSLSSEGGFRSYFNMDDGILDGKMKKIQFGSGKLWVLRDILEDIFSRHERSVILTQTTSMLEILSVFMEKHANFMKFTVLQRVQSVTDIHGIISDLSVGEDVRCLLMLERIGSRFLEALGVEHIIFFDTDWNPLVKSLTKLSIQRILLSNNKTRIVRLVSRGTIEVPMTLPCCNDPMSDTKDLIDKDRRCNIHLPHGFDVLSCTGDGLKSLVESSWKVLSSIEPPRERELILLLDKDYRVERSTLLSNYILGSEAALGDADSKSKARKSRKAELVSFIVNQWENWKFNEFERRFKPIDLYAVHVFLRDDSIKGSLLGNQIPSNRAVSKVGASFRARMGTDGEFDWIGGSYDVADILSEFFYDISVRDSSRSREANSLLQYFSGRIEDSARKVTRNTNENEFFFCQPDVIHPLLGDREGYTFPHYFFSENESISALLPLKKLKPLKVQYSSMEGDEEVVAEKEEETESMIEPNKRRLRKRKSRYSGVAEEASTPQTETWSSPTSRKKVKKEEPRKIEVRLGDTWNEKEDKVIKASVKRFGLNWSLMVILLSCLPRVPGFTRSESDCLKRYQELEQIENKGMMGLSLRQSVRASRMAQSRSVSNEVEVEEKTSVQNRSVRAKRESSFGSQHKTVLKAIKSAMGKKKSLISRIGLGDKSITHHSSYDKILRKSEEFGVDPKPSMLLEFLKKRAILGANDPILGAPRKKRPNNEFPHEPEALSKEDRKAQNSSLSGSSSRNGSTKIQRRVSNEWNVHNTAGKDENERKDTEQVKRSLLEEAAPRRSKSDVNLQKTTASKSAGFSTPQQQNGSTIQMKMQGTYPQLQTGTPPPTPYSKYAQTSVQGKNVVYQNSPSSLANTFPLSMRRPANIAPGPNVQSVHGQVFSQGIQTGRYQVNQPEALSYQQHVSSGQGTGTIHPIPQPGRPYSSLRMGYNVGMGVRVNMGVGPQMGGTMGINNPENSDHDATQGYQNQSVSTAAPPQKGSGFFGYGQMMYIQGQGQPQMNGTRAGEDYGSYHAASQSGQPQFQNNGGQNQNVYGRGAYIQYMNQLFRMQQQQPMYHAPQLEMGGTVNPTSPGKGFLQPTQIEGRNQEIGGQRHQSQFEQPQHGLVAGDQRAARGKVPPPVPKRNYDLNQMCMVYPQMAAHVQSIISNKELSDQRKDDLLNELYFSLQNTKM